MAKSPNSRKRQGISAKTRFEVFKRDGFRCMYCGATPPGVLLQVDHIDPVALGGTNDQDNLITACQPCNAGKSATPLSAVPQSLAEKAAEVEEREKQVAGYQSILAAKRERLDDEAWEIAELWMGWHRRDSFRKDWLTSVRQFVERIGFRAAHDAMEVALSRVGGQDRSFRYFCGVCWSKIREQERAQ